MNVTRRSPAPRPEGVADGAAFAGCTESQRRRLDQLAAVVTVPAGRVLTRQGAAGQEFGVILDGEVAVDIDGHEVARLHPGDHYGEMALFDETAPTHRRLATVTAATDATVAAMSVSEFRTLLREMPEIAERLLRTALERHRAGALSGRIRLAGTGR